MRLQNLKYYFELELDVDSAKLNRRPKYLRRWSFFPKVIVGYNYKQTHADNQPIALLDHY